MPVNKEAYQHIKTICDSNKVTLIAVSKTKPASDIMELYELGHRDFGENYVQELVEKEAQLPKDIHWHFIGHLQSNKVKYIAPFVHLIHGVDSAKLLQEINKQGAKLIKQIPCLLQAFIAQEETKFGLDAKEIEDIMQAYVNKQFTNVVIKGFMGMASFTENKLQIEAEFKHLHSLYTTYTNQCNTLSMGMSGDYELAIANGSNMIRVGSLLFGERNYNK
jgi:PLP dependent protein